MPSKRKLPAILRTMICASILASSLLSAATPFKKLMGSIKDDVYTGPEKDFRVHIPVHKVAGGRVRDEREQRSEIEGSQVIFTDAYGSFYRVLSIKTSKDIDDLMNVFHDVRDKQTVQTAHGRELRVIDVEKEGAEIRVTIITAGSPPQVQTPDMVTANAIFAANGRIYHVSAGYPVFRATVEERMETARQGLDEFLAGFETLDAAKGK